MNRFEEAKKIYAELGVDVEEAIKKGEAILAAAK